MADEKDAKLVTALRLAKKMPMNFAFVAKGATEGVLIVSKKRIPTREINDAKEAVGAKKVFRGRCTGEDGIQLLDLNDPMFVTWRMRMIKLVALARKHDQTLFHPSSHTPTAILRVLLL